MVPGVAAATTHLTVIRTRTNKEKEDAEDENRKRKQMHQVQRYAAVEQKVNATWLSVPVFIRGATLGKELSVALTIEESERMKCTVKSAIRCRSILTSLQSWPTFTACSL